MSIGELVTLAADSSLNTQSINLSELANTGISYTPFVIPSVSTKPTYSLSSSQTFINEGASALFTLTTTNVVAGTSIPYLISGITANDLLIGELSGTLIVGSNGTGTISIPIAADNLTEGPETLYMKIESYSSSTIINDTSVSLVGVYDGGGGGGGDGGGGGGSAGGD
jgi:hypothetical protein